MTVETKLALTEQDIRSYSTAKQEPSWFAEYRVQALLSGRKVADANTR